MHGRSEMALADDAVPETWEDQLTPCEDCGWEFYWGEEGGECESCGAAVCALCHRKHHHH